MREFIYCKPAETRRRDRSKGQDLFFFSFFLTEIRWIPFNFGSRVSLNGMIYTPDKSAVVAR